MTKHDALIKVAKLVEKTVTSLPVDEQIEIWNALKATATTDAQRDRCEAIAFSLLEARRDQLDFFAEQLGELNDAVIGNGSTPH